MNRRNFITTVLAFISGVFCIKTVTEKPKSKLTNNWELRPGTCFFHTKDICMYVYTEDEKWVQLSANS